MTEEIKTKIIIFTSRVMHIQKSNVINLKTGILRRAVLTLIPSYGRFNSFRSEIFNELVDEDLNTYVLVTPLANSMFAIRKYLQNYHVITHKKIQINFSSRVKHYQVCRIFHGFYEDIDFIQK